MVDMSVIRPIPMSALLLISGFAGLVGWFRYYSWTRKSAPLSLVPQVRVLRLDANLGREGRNEPQVSPNEGRTRDTH